MPIVRVLGAVNELQAQEREEDRWLDMAIATTCIPLVVLGAEEGEDGKSKKKPDFPWESRAWKSE